MVAVVLAAGCAILLERFGLASKGQVFDRVLVAAIPTLVVLAAYGSSVEGVQRNTRKTR